MQTISLIMTIVQVAVHLTFLLLIVHVVGEYRRMFRETFSWASAQREMYLKEIKLLNEKIFMLEAERDLKR